MTPDRAPVRNYIIALAVLFALALGIRLVFIHQCRFAGDEARFYGEARAVVATGMHLSHVQTEAAVLKALDKAERETGEKTIYLVSITNESSRVHEKARRAVKAGATGLLVAYSVGLSTFKDLADDPEINVPIMLHPSHMLGMIKTYGWVALSKLCRLSGADLTLSPSLWSSLQTCSVEEELRTSQTLPAPFYHIKRTWPMPSEVCTPAWQRC